MMGYGGSDQRFEVTIAGNEPSYYRTYGAKPKAILSREEKKNLLVAIAALTVALTMAMFWGARGMIVALREAPEVVGFIALIALASTTTAFLLHEMAHKFVAQRYGCWAEFRYSTQGLVIALLLSAFMGLLLAAPGAVYIAGRIDKRQNGIISIAGPLTNTVVALAVMPLVLFGDGLVQSGAYLVVYFNAFLAIFNMLPMNPLDGAKVLKWNPGIYIISVVIMGSLLAYTWFVLTPY